MKKSYNKWAKPDFIFLDDLIEIEDVMMESIRNIQYEKAKKLQSFYNKHIWMYKYFPKWLIKKLVLFEIKETNCAFSTNKIYILKINKIFYWDFYFDIF